LLVGEYSGKKNTLRTGRLLVLTSQSVTVSSRQEGLGSNI
jgi:hypothetical protein